MLSQEEAYAWRVASEMGSVSNKAPRPLRPTLLLLPDQGVHVLLVNTCLPLNLRKA